jgi:hypothetical protein
MASKRTLNARLFRITSILTMTAGGLFVFGVGCTNDASSSKQSENAGGTYVYDINEAAVPANVTATAACARYVIANCLRRNECLGSSDDCNAAVAYCPDALFSDGSTRNPSTTWACADALRSRACEDLVVGRNPDCVTSGTRKTGESCIGAAQCASLACTGSPATCGVCVERRSKDQTCAVDAPCQAGLLCDSVSTTCIEPDAATLNALLTRVPLKLGEPCDGNSLCTDGTYCALAEGQTVGTCTTRLAIGVNCDVSEACVAGSYCAIESIRCVEVPTAGKRCGNDNKLNVSMWCDENSYCDDKTVQCTPLPTAELPCGTNLQLGNVPALCATGTYCDSLLTPPTCKTLANAGTSCTNSETCAPDLSCLCDDAACTKKSCGVLRQFGESCSTVGEHCMVQIGGCVEGICQPNESQGLFTSLCGA